MTSSVFYECKFICACCVLSHFSCIRLFVMLWTVALQAPLSIGFSRQEYWSGLPFPSGHLPSPGIKSTSLTSPTLAGGFLTTSTTWDIYLQFLNVFEYFIHLSNYHLRLFSGSNALRTDHE